MINISNQNENLFFQTEQNKQPKINAKQYFIEKIDQPSIKSNTFVIRFISCNILVYTFAILVLLGCIIPMTIFTDLVLYIKLCVDAIGVSFSLILFIFCINILNTIYIF